jgi:murein DD-endopeptidase MepM/ murein hydrolase activator NlpD
VAKQPDSQPGRVYRGRRRLPKLPSRRYAAVVSTAFVAASVVALGASTMLPDDLTNAEREDLLTIADQLDRDDRSNRSQDFGPAVSVDAYAPAVWLLPIRDRYTISSEFGWRASAGRPHWGTDLAAAYGTPIYAVHDGVVQYGGYEGSGYGIFAQIDHGSGVDIFYAHMSERYVVTGQHVRAGQLIGRVGSSGRSTGNHLHFEVRVHGGFYEAETFMREHGVDLRTRQEEANGGVVG